jgi:hypothetical protein
MKRKKKSKMGRPPVPAAKKRREQVSVAMTASELKRLEKIASAQGLSISELLMRPWRQEEKNGSKNR